ncbi:indole-3-glycerol phosphate synthase TrpC [Legionella pneumophila]|uniref:Indole-3-glycerol phosphate synthase n=1 Tax=Legionella pneumophila subsp. pascullei TaxID=91890 RepID=A0AAX2IV25_LEGPN|nr:indole-3-glycerol phosphate synthase TrpC [Legionella pneumophila]AMP90459.1 indole-3-glycerol phosphate synthase [Legionella pneumophila subsp. pascullei]AMP91873.1 indole-3-glycerol phosphate synthase [Legionella pneumophila subsp. pascullei]AMP94839.1 indole-3-glycerol phosphate synthase [Legionella pneumophila subsp. pascullei]SQG89693.1 indole-3-glycerol phosphate synthase [Legionella pneumophila subsp. pascullei]VEH05218.1 indole-3-glycerol phosphate synthase [Legionella pneumophila s
MNSILERIAQHKLEEIAVAKKNKPLHVLSKQRPGEIRDFTTALKSNASPAIIAEIKKASPSKGLIRKDFNVAEIAKTYTQHGARCLSVLTDIEFFQGHPDYLALAKSKSTLPVLRKDFIIDSYQIYESLVLGADCILLIVALLDDVQLMDFCQLAQELKMSVLVESHTQDELERALRLPTPLIGINNRSLHTFKTDIQLSIQLKQLAPKDKIIITESGINTREDIKLMQSHGINAFLIGESLMRADNIGKALQELMHN